MSSPLLVLILSKSMLRSLSVTCSNPDQPYFRSYINRPEVLQQYLNSLYEPHNSVIWPSVAPQSLVNYSVTYKYHHIY